MNPGLLHCGQILYHLSQHGISKLLEWVAYPFSRGSSWPRNPTRISCIAGFFTWATVITFRKAIWVIDVQFSRSVMSDSLWSHACQTFLSITNSWSLLKLMSIKAVMQCNHLILCPSLSFCLQSFPASGSFLMSQFFTSGGQSIGASASAFALPMNIWDWCNWYNKTWNRIDFFLTLIIHTLHFSM